MTTTCPECYGKGQFRGPDEYRNGMGGLYEAKTYHSCARCLGEGEIQSTPFESDHEKRITHLENEIVLLRTIIASLCDLAAAKT